jgi:WD40 repeat protein
MRQFRTRSPATVGLVVAGVVLVGVLALIARAVVPDAQPARPEGVPEAAQPVQPDKVPEAPPQDPGAAFNRARAANNLKDYKVPLLVVAYSPDGKTLATGSDYQDGEAVLWDVATGRRKLTLEGTGHVSGVAFSPDGKKVYTGGTRVVPNGPLPPRYDPVVAVWDAEKGGNLGFPERPNTSDTSGRGEIMGLHLSPDGRWLIALHGKYGSTVRRWDTRAGEWAPDGNNRRPPVASAFSLSPDNNVAAISNGVDKVRFWDVDAWAPAKPDGKDILRGSEDAVWASAFSRDGKTLITAVGRAAEMRCGLVLWDVATQRGVGRLSGHRKAVRAMAVSNNGKLLATSDVIHADGRVVIWDLSTRKPKATLKPPPYPRHLVFSPDDTSLVCSTSFGVEFVDVGRASGNAFEAEDRAEAERRAAFEKVSKRVPDTNRYPPVAAFSAEGKRFVLAEADGQVRVWDAANLDRPVATFEPGLPSITAVTFGPDGKRLAVGGGDFNGRVASEARVWDLDAGKVVLSIKAHTRPVRALAFSPDGAFLASGADHWDHTVRVWDLTTGRQVAMRDVPELDVAQLAYHPNEKLLVATGPRHRDAFFVWDWAGSGKTEVLGPTGDHSDWLTFAAEGKLLVRVRDNRIDVLDWPARKLRNTVDTVGVKVACQAVSPDGRRAAIGGMRNIERDFVIWVCDLTAGKRWTVQQGTHFSPYALAFTPDGRLAALAAAHDGLRLAALQAGGD